MAKKTPKIRQVTKFHHQKQTLLVTWKVMGAKDNKAEKNKIKAKVRGKFSNNNLVLY